MQCALINVFLFVIFFSLTVTVTRTVFIFVFLERKIYLSSFIMGVKLHGLNFHESESFSTDRHCSRNWPKPLQVVLPITEECRQPLRDCSQLLGRCRQSLGGCWHPLDNWRLTILRWWSFDTSLTPPEEVSSRNNFDWCKKITIRAIFSPVLLY